MITEAMLNTNFSELLVDGKNVGNKNNRIFFISRKIVLRAVSALS